MVDNNRNFADQYGEHLKLRCGTWVVPDKLKGILFVILFILFLYQKWQLTSTIQTSYIYEVATKLPEFSNNVDSTQAKNLLKQFANENNFHLTVLKSDSRRIHLGCSKGGTYRNVRKIANEDRQRAVSTRKIGCPYEIRCKISGGAVTVKEQTDMQMYHNHPLIKEDFCSTSEGRLTNLTAEDLKTLQDGIKNKVPTKMIQRSISNGKSYDSLYAHDIANMKAQQARKEAMPFRNSDGTVLIEKMKSQNFKVVYRRCHEDYIGGIFFATESMLARAKRFNEVLIIDATYGTNIQKMPLISA